MALSKIPEQEPVNQQTPPKARDELMRSAVVDEQYGSQIGLENYAAGFSVEVEYYEQILDEHDEQASLQLARDEAGQQYRHIERFPIKLQSGMQPIYDGQTRRFSAQGSFVMPALVVPKIGDMILLSGLDHRVAVYSITQIIPKNISLAPAYECEVSFQGLLNEERLANLKLKTIDEAVYDADQLKHGKHPVLATVAYNRKYEYLRMALEVTQIYYHEFYNRDINTLLIPGQVVAMYDPWCVRAFNRLWGALEGKTTRRFQMLNCDDGPHADAKSVFELVLDKNEMMESQLTVEFSLVHYKEFFPYPQTGGVRFSGVRGVMWPVYGFQSYYDLKPTPADEPKNPFMTEAPVEEEGQQRLYPLVTEDKYYVFTEAFYRKSENMTVLEGMVRNLIEDKLVNHPELVRLVNAIPFMPPLERYYFTPFILMLLRAGAIEP